MRRGAALTVMLWLFGVATGGAQTLFPLTISGNQAQAVVELPGGFATEVAIMFEDVVGFNANALELSAQVINPLSGNLLSRLPGGLSTSLLAAFPVLLRIEPSASSALAMSGVVTISLHTHNLNLEPNSPLGLYSASNGGAFRDITKSVGMGSYRVNGSGPGFSEFLIVADTRPLDQIVVGKFDALQSLLNEHSSVMPLAVVTDLQQRLDQARTAYQTHAYTAAIAALSGFDESVRQHSGTAIPDVWRAHDPRVNVAGVLRSRADTLRYSLTLKAAGR